jgi:hypothetical protein
MQTALPATAGFGQEQLTTATIYNRAFSTNNELKEFI